MEVMILEILSYSVCLIEFTLIEQIRRIQDSTRKASNLDPQHTNDLLKHLEKQNDLLKEVRKKMVEELQKLEVEEHMMMHKLEDILTTHRLNKKVFSWWLEVQAKKARSPELGFSGTALLLPVTLSPLIAMLPSWITPLTASPRHCHMAPSNESPML